MLDFVTLFRFNFASFAAQQPLLPSYCRACYLRPYGFLRLEVYALNSRVSSSNATTSRNRNDGRAGLSCAFQLHALQLQAIDAGPCHGSHKG
jgi:hypothetical protein